MIKVKQHGQTIPVTNQITGQTHDMTYVTFTEDSRVVEDKLAGASAFLARVLGKSQVEDIPRVHNQLIMTSKLDLFPIGKELDGYINRILYNNPTASEKLYLGSAIVNGELVYYKTWIAKIPRDDVDKRVFNVELFRRRTG